MESNPWSFLRWGGSNSNFRDIIQETLCNRPELHKPSNESECLRKRSKWLGRLSHHLERLDGNADLAKPWMERRHRSAKIVEAFGKMWLHQQPIQPPSSGRGPGHSGTINNGSLNSQQTASQHEASHGEEPRKRRKRPRLRKQPQEALDPQCHRPFKLLQPIRLHNRLRLGLHLSTTAAADPPANITSTCEPGDGASPEDGLCWQGYTTRRPRIAQSSQSGWWETIQQNGGQRHRSLEESQRSTCLDPIGKAQTSSRVDEACDRQHRTLDRPRRLISTTECNIADSGIASPSRDGNCKSCTARTQQGSHPSRCRRRSTMRPIPRRRGGADEIKAGENPESMCRSCRSYNQRRSNANRFLGQRKRSRGPSNKEQKDKRNCSVKKGSALKCLRKFTHEPKKKVTWDYKIVEAYETCWDWHTCAASKIDPRNTVQHSVQDERDYVSVWKAQMTAAALHFELFLEDFEKTMIEFEITNPFLEKPPDGHVLATYGPQPASIWRLFTNEESQSNLDHFRDITAQGHQAPNQRAPPIWQLPSWIGELWILLGRFGVTTQNGHELPVATWYLHGRHDRTCFHARILRLDDTYEAWEQDVRHLWNDKIIQRESLQFHLVMPNDQRLMTTGPIAHLLLVQTPMDLKATLMTFFDHPHVTRFMQRAKLMPQQVSKETWAASSGAGAQCLNRAQLGAPCQVSIDQHQLADGEIWQCENGNHAVIQVPWPDQEQGDEASFMATGPPRHAEDLPIIENADAVLQGEEQDHHLDEQTPDFEEAPPEDDDIEGSGQSADEPFAPSTYVFQLDYYPAHVRLADHRIERTLCQVLRWDTYELRSFHHLHRAPDDLTGSRGLIVIKDTDIPQGSQHQMVLVDVVFFSNPPSMETPVDRTVRLLPKFVTGRGLLGALGLKDYCNAIQDYQCVLWLNDDRFSQHRVITLRHGDYMRIWIPPMTATCGIPTRFAARCLSCGLAPAQVSDRFLETAVDEADLELIPERNPYMIEDAHMSLPLFQVNARKISIADTLKPAATQLRGPRVNLTPASEAVNWLEEHFILPCFDIQEALGADKNWHPSSLEWIQQSWFAHDKPVQEVWIYFDGSFLPPDDAIGFAAAVFTFDGWNWEFAGATSGHRNADHTGAYRAELCAATLACKLAFDIVKLQEAIFSNIPAVHFVFDSLTVGRQLEGTWSAHCAKEHAHFNRSLIKLIETRFATVCSYHFTPGHADDPGNELVDVVAKEAAKGSCLHDWKAFFTHVLKSDFVCAAEWGWILFDPTWTEVIQNYQLQMPAKPSAKPSTEMICCYLNKRPLWQVRGY